ASGAVMKVGRNAVVPVSGKRRTTRPHPAASGSARSTPKKPLTCRSISPGTMYPRPRARSGERGGGPPATSATRPSVTRTYPGSRMPGSPVPGTTRGAAISNSGTIRPTLWPARTLRRAASYRRSGAGLAAGLAFAVSVGGATGACLGRRQAGLQRVGQAAAAFFHLELWPDHLVALHLRRHELFQRLPVTVAVHRRVEVHRHRVDQRGGHLQLLRAHLDILVEELGVGRAALIRHRPGL